MEQPLIRSYSNLKFKRRDQNKVEIGNRRRPQNIRSEISQRPLIGSSSNFKLNPKWKIAVNERRTKNIKSGIFQH